MEVEMPQVAVPDTEELSPEVARGLAAWLHATIRAEGKIQLSRRTALLLAKLCDRFAGAPQ